MRNASHWKFILMFFGISCNNCDHMLGMMGWREEKETGRWRFI